MWPSGGMSLWTPLPGTVGPSVAPGGKPARRAPHLPLTKRPARGTARPWVLVACTGMRSARTVEEEEEAWQEAATAEEATTGGKGCSGKSWCCWHTKVLALSIFSHPRMPASWLFFRRSLKAGHCSSIPFLAYMASAHTPHRALGSPFFFSLPLFSSCRVTIMSVK